MSREYPTCFDNYMQYARWLFEAIKERDADWQAHCSESGIDPDSIRASSASRRVYPLRFQVASICEDCTPEYQQRMTCERRCANPVEALPVRIYTEDFVELWTPKDTHGHP